MQNFGESIKTLRKSADLTQAQFADKLDVHLQTISKWERGLLVPDFSLLGEIASALSVSLETLLGFPQGEETYTGNFDMTAFGRALAEARKKKNESQSELAEVLGVSTDNISKWERGVTCPDVAVFISMAEHFDMPASRLYFGILEETEVELPAQWQRRKRLHLLWFACAVLPLCVAVVVLSVLLAALPRATAEERTVFAVNYWLCGGTFRTEVPDTIRKEDGEVTLAIPYKAGSEFLGWYRSFDYSGEQVQTITCEGEDISVYAKWSDLTYEVRYELGGGVLPDPNPALVTAQEAHSLIEPVRQGYLFLGWFDGPENGTRYESVGGANAANLTLYALWQKCDSKFAVKYELGGGTLQKQNPSWVGAGEIHPLNAPEKRGYAFLGWNERADGTGEYVATLYAIAEDLTLYAVYAPKTYLVRYVYEGFYPGDEVNPNNIGFGERVVLLPVERYGGDFLGWYTRETGGERVEVLDESNLPETPVLYARFEPWRYTIELDAGSGSFFMEGAEASAFALELVYGETYTLPVPQLNDYLFLGWETESGEKVAEIGPHNICDMKLRAHWRPVELRYRIRYELGGGVQDPNNPTEGLSGERVYLHEPQKTGYLFLGWFDNAEGEGERYVYLPEDREEDILLYAVWQEIITAGSVDHFTYEKGAHSVKITGYTGPIGEDVDLIFPGVIEGLPVTEISYPSCSSGYKYLHSVTIPHSVTVLGDNIFNHCIVTQPLMIPPEVERIGSYCFWDFEGKVCFAEHGNLRHIGEAAFFDSHALEGVVTLPHGVETIGDFAFKDAHVEGFILPDTVQTIGEEAFFWISQADDLDIFLPSSLTYIGKEAFNVYGVRHGIHSTLTYEQTKNFHPQWGKISERLEQKHTLTLSDDGYSETLGEDYVFALPKRKKAGFTFLGWKNAAGEFVHNCYFPHEDETLYAAYEEETPADGRTPERAIPLVAGRVYEVNYLSMECVWFVWQGEDAALSVNLITDEFYTYLFCNGTKTEFKGTCKCKKGDIIGVGGVCKHAGTVLKLTVAVT